MKTVVSIALFVIVAMLSVAPAVAQAPPVPYTPPGYFVNWIINLHPATADGGSGIVQYYVAAPTLHRPSTANQEKGYATLSVECEYLTFPDLTPLDVFIGPSHTPSEPFGKLVGHMQVGDGSATFLTARPPVVSKGTTVTIVRNGIVVMTGRF